MINLTYLKQIPHLLRTIWLIIGITFLFIIFLDIFLGLLLSLYSYPKMGEHRIMAYEEKDREWASDYFREFEKSSEVDWKSYVYWRRKHYTGKYINVDLNGIRHTYIVKIEDNNKADKLTIFMFGGSTLWGTAARDDWTIPSLVAKHLSKHGINSQITNFGESGYVSTQEVIELLLLLQQGKVPDIVIFYDGANDTFSAFQNGIAGIPQNESNRSKEFNLLLRPKDLRELFLVKRLKNTNIYQVCSKIFNGLFKHQPRPVGQENCHDNENYHLAESVANIYLSNIKLVETLGKDRFVPLFYWQPTIFNKKNLTNYERQESQVTNYSKFIKLAYDVIHNKTTELEKSKFKNLSDIFMNNDEGLFVDWCHINEKGNEIIAATIADDIVKIWSQKNYRGFPGPKNQ